MTFSRWALTVLSVSAQIEGNLLVRLPSHHQLKYLSFPGCQSRQKIAQAVQPEKPLALRGVIGNGLLDRCDQSVLADRLGKKVFRTGLQCPDTCRYVAMAGEKDHRQQRRPRSQGPCTSVPLTSGIFTSSKTQPGSSSLGR